MTRSQKRKRRLEEEAARHRQQEQAAAQQEQSSPSPQGEGGQEAKPGSSELLVVPEVPPDMVAMGKDRNGIEMVLVPKEQLVKMMYLALKQLPPPPAPPEPPPYKRMFGAGVVLMALMVLSMGACMHYLQKKDQAALSDQLTSMQNSMMAAVTTASKGKELPTEELKKASDQNASALRNFFQGAMSEMAKRLSLTDKKLLDAQGKMEELMKKPPSQPTAPAVASTPPIVPQQEQKVVVRAMDVAPTGKAVRVINETADEIKVFAVKDGKKGDLICTIPANHYRTISYEGFYESILQVEAVGQPDSDIQEFMDGAWKWEIRSDSKNGVRTKY